MTAPPIALQERLAGVYGGKRVLLTGHTGFKGGWLAHWLHLLGAKVTGYALAPDPQPCLFEAAAVAGACEASHLADVRDLPALRRVVRELRPEFVFHLAAQPLVRLSYEAPLETLATNVTGTAHVLEALRQERVRCAAVMVTSDKCYENRERAEGYREDEAMGGHDPYSMSKGAAELVIASWRRSFFSPAKLGEHGVAVASARAGNVVGGGDWAQDRIVPDCVRALAAGAPIPVRNPGAVRPWQHVLEPLGGYLVLGAALAGRGLALRQAQGERGCGAAEAQDERAPFCEGWNFGPHPEDARTVREVVEALIASWGAGRWEDRRQPGAVHEAGVLRLSIEKAAARLGWSPRWRFDETFRRTVTWYRAHHQGAGPAALAELCRSQIRDYMAT